MTWSQLSLLTDQCEFLLKVKLASDKRAMLIAGHQNNATNRKCGVSRPVFVLSRATLPPHLSSLSEGQKRPLDAKATQPSAHGVGGSLYGSSRANLRVSRTTDSAYHLLMYR